MTRSDRRNSPGKNAPVPKEPVKIGLYLQTDELRGKKRVFRAAMSAVRRSDIDILVLPEFSYVPFEREFRKADLFRDGDVRRLYSKTLDLSRDIGKAVVICNQDRYGTVMSIYANVSASEGETRCKSYIKHTMTGRSACELEDYARRAEEMFRPVVFKGHRIGLTVCYDCNHAVFSRRYGLNGADIIINSTGGDVVYDKWYKYNKVRAIENRCFTFVTMGGSGEADDPHSYVYGFTPSGREMRPVLLGGKYEGKRNVPGGIYVYDTAADDGTAEPDPSVEQTETGNKRSDLFIPASDVYSFYLRGQRLTDRIRVLHRENVDIIMCLVDGADILKPEAVLKLLYAEQLKQLPNKRYILINRWDTVDTDLYKTQLSVVLKVRAMENYCAVVLTSGNLTKCFQCGQNRTAQVVKAENGQFGIDLARTGGPETIWRNKTGMKAAWRENIQWLIDSMDEAPRKV